MAGYQYAHSSPLSIRSNSILNSSMFYTWSVNVMQSVCDAISPWVWHCLQKMNSYSTLPHRDSCGLCVLWTLLVTSVPWAGSWRMMANRHNHTTTSNTLPQHTIKTNKSTWKHSNFPTPIGRQAHANFTMTDCCSGLSRSA